MAGSQVSHVPSPEIREFQSTSSPPCCLVDVGLDRQSWLPGPRLEVTRRRTGELQKVKIGGASGIQVLHLLRWFTHTPRSSGAFLEEAARSRKSGSCTEIQNAYGCYIILFLELTSGLLHVPIV